MPGFPEPTQWNGADNMPLESSGEDSELSFMEDCQYLSEAVIDFAQKYGIAKMLRWVSYAVDAQQNMSKE